MFRFSGRASRSTFWGTHILGWVLFVAVVGIAYAISAHDGEPVQKLKTLGNEALQATNPLIGFAILLAWLCWAITLIAVGVRRCHDHDRSGLWLLVYNLGPTFLAVGAGIAAQHGEPIALLCAIGAVVVFFWAFIELGCLRGTVGPNRFGPDPLAPYTEQNISTANSYTNPTVVMAGTIRDSQPTFKPSSKTASDVTPSSTDDDLYEIAANEIECGTFSKGVWTRILVHNNGDVEKTKIECIKLRFDELERVRARAIEANVWQKEREERLRLQELLHETARLDLERKNKLAAEMKRYDIARKAGAIAARLIKKLHI